MAFMRAMTGPLARGVAAAVLIGALSPSASARTEDGFVWSQKSSGGLISLAYGPADPAQMPLFLLSCLNGMSIAVLDVRPASLTAQHGDRLTIELTAGDVTSPVEAEAIRDDAEGITFGEASDIEVKPILDVLRGSGPVTVKIGDTSAILSDQGRADAVDRFTQACDMA